MTDRWRLRFPLWQRYPAEQDGEYPFVPNRGARSLRPERPQGRPADHRRQHLPDPDRRSSETPFEFRTRADAVRRQHRTSRTRTSSSARASSSRCCRPASSRSSCSSGSTAFRPRDWAFRVTPVVQPELRRTRTSATSSTSRRKRARRGGAGLRAPGGVRRGQAVRRRRQLRLRLGPRRHPAVHQRLPRLPLPRHQPRRARCSATGAATAISGTSPTSISSRRRPTAS